MHERIFLSAPDVREFEREYLLDALDSNWIAPAGPHLDAFETALATATGRKHAVCLSSGTAALHLALLEAGVGPGDDVLCSTLTFIGSANPILYCGASPVFVDSQASDWNMDPDVLEHELARRAEQDRLPRAAVVVDLYGQCADYARIEPILDRYGVTLIEDAAEALGAKRGGRLGGSFGRNAILSFNGNKIITSGGGGAFVTDSDETADRIRYLSTQARQPAVHYEHTEVGYNYRMSNLSAAVGRAQLHTLHARIARRQHIGSTYQAALADIDEMHIVQPPVDVESNHWLSCGLIESASATEQRDGLIESLRALNIESRPVWKPMHLQPIFAHAEGAINGTAERLFSTGICLPSGSGMTDDEISRVAAALTEFFARR